MVLGVQPDEKFPLWPRAEECVVLLDEKGRMVKRLKHIATEEGTQRAWCWVEGDNARLSEMR